MKQVEKFNQPQPCGLDKKGVAELAEDAGVELGYQPGGDLEALVKRLGGKIKYQSFSELESSSSGSIKIRGKRDFEIFLAAHTGVLRDRFTIAHELGHYVLHYLVPLQQGRDVGMIQAERYGTGRVEWEANWFAAAFLMPTTRFKKDFKTLKGNWLAIAEQFGVSISAAKVRAQTLGLA